MGFFFVFWTLVILFQVAMGFGSRWDYHGARWLMKFNDEKAGVMVGCISKNGGME
jgi:hypothetical protein